MKTVPLNQTVTLFPYPAGFSNLQCSMFDQIIAWLNDECLENDDWNGEDRYMDFASGDKAVFEAIDSLCKVGADGARFYWAALGEGKYKVGVVRSQSEP